MDDRFDFLLFKLIKEQYQLGHDNKTALTNICQKLDYASISMKFVKKLLRQMKNKNFQIYCHYEHKNYYDIFMKINEYHFIFNNAILWEDDGFKKEFDFLPDDPRYGIKCNVVNGQMNGFKIIDHYYGKIRLVF